MAVLYHNPRCSKSRQAKAMLEAAGVDCIVREYLQEPLTRQELGVLRQRLDTPVADWVRFNEDEASEAGITPESDEETLLDALAQHPKLLQRPIYDDGGRAVVGRPPERIKGLLALA